MGRECCWTRRTSPAAKRYIGVMRMCLRILWNGIAAISLLLCIAMVSLWIRGYRVEDLVSWHRTEWWTIVRSVPDRIMVDVNVSDWSHGKMGIEYAQGPANPDAVDSARWTGLTLNVDAKDRWIRWERGGFALWHWGSPQGNSISTIVTPTWAWVVATGIPWMAWTLGKLHRRFKARRAAKAGLCAVCGYDLRATPGRCPECGAGR